jgi:hypothetical protein
MAPPVSLEDLEKKKDEMLELAKTLEGLEDHAQIQAIAEQLAEQGKELEILAAEFAGQSDATAKSRTAWAEVVLTPDQRKRILEATGVEMETVKIRDDGGFFSLSMPYMAPSVIEAYALREAERRKQGKEGEEIAQQQLDQALADLDAAGPQVQEKLEELKQDPNFLGGMLNKK